MFKQQKQKTNKSCQKKKEREKKNTIFFFSIVSQNLFPNIHKINETNKVIFKKTWDFDPQPLTHTHAY